MNLQFELSWLIGVVITIVGGFWAVAQLALRQTEKRADERHATLNSQIAKIDTDIKAEVAHWQRLEREVMSLKAELPLYYVRRDDFVRVQSVIEAKLDGLALRIENANLRKGQE